MSDSDQVKKPAGAIPAWQQETAPEPTTTNNDNDNDHPALAPAQQNQDNDQLQVARRFLEQEEVKTASREKKMQFLKSKGIRDSHIEELLGQSADNSESSSQTKTPESDATPAASASQSPSLPSTTSDRPPIVTYPEFLVKPERPPPLVTKTGILNTLYAFAGLSTLLYGTSKYLVSPMVESLTEARSELHDTTAKRLDSLVAQLEKTVSVIPPTDSQPAPSDDSSGSEAEDPTEMFHRDIGTQTSLLEQVAAPAVKQPEPASKRHADSLKSLAKTLSVLKDQFRAQSEGFEDVKTLLDVFRDDLDGLTYGGHAEFVGGYDVYGTARKNEPEDEIRKVRDNIRRVKGILLSARNFPPSTR